MLSSTTTVKFQIPKGLPQLVHGLSKAIIRAQPENLYEFCATYLEQELVLRNQNLGSEYKKNDEVEGKDKQEPEKYDGLHESIKKGGNEYSHEKAATKIQAGFRGYKSRKEMKQAQTRLSDQEIAKKLKPPLATIKEEEEAATKIQAGVRGYLTRKKMKQSMDMSQSSDEPGNCIGDIIYAPSAHPEEAQIPFSQSQEEVATIAEKLIEEITDLIPAEVRTVAETNEAPILKTNIVAEIPEKIDEEKPFLPGSNDRILELIKGTELVEEEISPEVECKAKFQTTVNSTRSGIKQPESPTFVETIVETDEDIETKIPALMESIAENEEDLATKIPAVEDTVDKNDEHIETERPAVVNTVIEENDEFIETDAKENVIRSEGIGYTVQPMSVDSDLPKAFDICNDDEKSDPEIKEIDIEETVSSPHDSFSGVIKLLEEIEGMDFGTEEDDKVVQVVSSPELTLEPEVETILQETIKETQNPAEETPESLVSTETVLPKDKEPEPEPPQLKKVEEQMPSEEPPVQRRSSKRKTVSGTEKYRSGIVLESYEPTPNIHDIPNLEEMDAEVESEVETLNNAAARIQAGFRGYQVRKGLNNAATRIQSNYRGYKTRKELKKKTKAAVKIQATVRGFLTRKKIYRNKSQQMEQRRRSLARRRSTPSAHHATSIFETAKRHSEG